MADSSAVDSLQHVVVCSASGETRIELQPRPVPGRGEIRVRLRACGLCGTDLFKLANATVPDGTVLGHELVGTVDAAGPGVVSFQVGDRDSAGKLLAEIRARLEGWLTAADRDGRPKSKGLFYYNRPWGTLIGYPASYGSDTELKIPPSSAGW